MKKNSVFMVILLMSFFLKSYAGIITFADANVKALCVANWDTNGDGELSEAEAAAVTSLGTVFRVSGISSFNELQYFTGLTSIGNYAFDYCSGLTSVTIPNSVTSIGIEAFDYCSGLTDVTIPNSVTSIGNYAFSGCSGLTEVTIPNSVTSIGYGAFSYCSGLTEIIVESGNTVYDSRDNCNAIIETESNTLIAGCKNTVIPNSVTSIGYLAFYDCQALTSLTIPNSVTSIGESAFLDCLGLTSVTIGNSVTSIGEEAFYDCQALTSVTIPNSVTSIGNSAFRHCLGLTSVTFGNSLTSIGNYAFTDGYHLTSITIPNSVRIIGNFAFSFCLSLTSVTIPNSVTSIGNSAFFGCSGLTSVTVEWETPITITETTFSNRANAMLYVPAGCKPAYEAADYWKEFGTIVEMESPSPIITFADANVKALCVQNWDTNGDGELSEAEAAAVTDLGEVFKGNTEIVSFDELQYFTGLTSISNQAFAGCRGLTSVTIPNSVTGIGESAFVGCYRLTSVTIPNSVTSIGEQAFSGCTGLTSITIPNSVTGIGEGAFDGCLGLTEIIVESGNNKYDSRDNCNAIIETASNTLITGCMNTIIPNSVTSIGEYAFWDCRGLTSVTIPNSVASIGSHAFYDCIGLTAVNIPNSVASIGAGAFVGCSSLTSVTVEWETPITITETTFSNRANATLYVPVGSTAAYEAANYWTDFKEILEMGAPSPDITFADANVKALCVQNWDTNGDGELSEAETAAVTTLGEVFKGNAEITSFDELQYFTGLTEIADGAFNECTKLESVILPSEVTRIGNWAFTTCNSLNTITIPASVTDIGAGAFAGCINMISMTVDTENTVYDSREDCNAIIHSSTNTVVAGCKNMTIPEGVTSIGDWALNGMWSLTSVVLPSSLTSIGTGAFSWCWSLPSITIPANVTSIGGGAFEGCSNLTSVTVENPDPVAIEESSFSNRANATLYVPAGSTAAYKAADYWKEFKEIVEWLNIAVNSDMEGTDNVCFFSRENYLENEEIVPSTIVEGTGVDGSRGIVVQSIDNPVNKWDTQFFIRLPQTLPAGTKYHISFDYKASQEVSGQTETHAEPGNCIYWNGVYIDYTTNWKHFELSGTVSAEQSPVDNPMRTIAFNLAVTPTSTTYYFDNVVFEIDKSQITPVAIVEEAPTPKELTYTGEAQELINPGEALGGTMQYSLDGTNFSPDIPTGTDAGEYTVYYKVVGDEDHDDSEVASVSVTIEEAGQEIEVTDISQLDNAIYVEPVDVRTGSQATLSFKMKNDVPIRSFQFDLYLPEGITAATNANSGKIMASLVNDRLPEDDGHTLTASIQQDGAIRFLCGSLDDENFAEGDGVVMTLKVEVAEDMQEGEYPVSLKTMTLNETDISHHYDIECILAKLTVSSYLPGDVNGDGTVNVLDYTGVANYIHENPADGFIFKAGDVDGNGVINVLDYTGVANIIHTGSPLGNNAAGAKAAVILQDGTDGPDPE